MKNQRILLIIPAYNEEQNILNTCKSIIQYNNEFDYIVVNDGSKDNTGKLCRENNLNHVNLINNLGIGGAVQAGYKYAFDNNYDIAIQFDGDGQHDIDDIEKLIKPIITDEIDFVIGSRFLATKNGFKSTRMRRFGITIISKMIKIVTGEKITDPTSGYRACNRKVIEKFALEYPREYPEPITVVNLIKNKYKLSEIPVEMKERVAGESSIKTWKTVYYMVNVALSIIVISMRRYK